MAQFKHPFYFCVCLSSWLVCERNSAAPLFVFDGLMEHMSHLLSDDGELLP